MAQNSRWRGTKDLEPGKAHYERTATKLIVTTDFQGPYAKCLALQPAIGQTITGFDAALKVTSSKVTELDGDAGRIDLTLETALDESTIDSAAIGEPSYEIEFNEVGRQIEAHPQCGTLNPARAAYKDGVKATVNEAGVPSPPDAKKRTWEDWADLTLSEGDDDNDYVKGGGDDAWTLTQYRELKEKGADDFLDFQPVIRRTTEHFFRPAGLGADSGKKQQPPSAANFTHLTGYQFLCGADRCTKSKRTYKRFTEWIGVRGEVDELLYDPPEP